MATSLLTGIKSPYSYGPPIPGSEKGGPWVKKPIYDAANPPPGWIGASQTPYAGAFHPIQSKFWGGLFGGDYTKPDLTQQGNYSDLIGGDWEVQLAEADMAAQMARARAGFRKKLNTALIDLGVTDPSKLGGFSQYIDADTITQAANNKYSRYAQVAQEEFNRQQNMQAEMADRGILTSGGTMKSTSDIIGAAEGSRYSALRDFLAGGEEGLSSIADLESSLAYRLAQARAAAADRAARTYPGWGDEDGTTTGPAGATTLAGGPRPAGLGIGPSNAGKPTRQAWSAAQQRKLAAARRRAYLAWKQAHGYVG